MPDNYPAIFFGSVPLHDYTGTASRNGFQYFDTVLHNDWSLHIYRVKHNGIPAQIEHYLVPGLTHPEVGQVAFCSGTFKTKVDDSSNMMIVIKTLQIQPVPGNVAQESYLERCPEPAHTQASVIGIVGEATCPVNLSSFHLKSFELNLSVWDPEHRSVPLALMCMFPEGKRFENYKLPKTNSLVSVTGALAGIHAELNCPMLLIQDLAYIRQGRGAGSDANMPTSSVPQTPTKSKWGAWAAPSPRSKVKPDVQDKGKGKGKRLLDEAEASPVRKSQVPLATPMKTSPPPSDQLPFFTQIEDFVAAAKDSPQSQLQAEAGMKNEEHGDEYIDVDSDEETP